MTNNRNEHDDQGSTMTDQPDDTSTDDTTLEEAGTVDDTDQDTAGNPNKEAAKYRRQLRDVEAERDTLTARIETMQRHMIEGEVQRAGYKPAAFWSRDANTPHQFFTDDGTLNTDQLAEAITTTARELGLPNGRGPVAPREGGTSRPRPAKSWDSAFRAQTS